jgi:hypothetical protein
VSQTATPIPTLVETPHHLPVPHPLWRERVSRLVQAYQSIVALDAAARRTLIRLEGLSLAASGDDMGTRLGVDLVDVAERSSSSTPDWEAGREEGEDLG